MHVGRRRHGEVERLKMAVGVAPPHIPDQRARVGVEVRLRDDERCEVHADALWDG